MNDFQMTRFAPVSQTEIAKSGHQIINFWTSSCPKDNPKNNEDF